MRLKRTPAALAALVVTSALALGACGGGSIKNAGAPSGGKDCGDLNMAVNPWVGYEADAYVVGSVAQTKLGCTVNYKEGVRQRHGRRGHRELGPPGAAEEVHEGQGR
jgi:glycine betaine/proline transport system substrate-binding protein